MAAESGSAAEPLLTVVVPTYNRADYIAETLESVVAQSYRNVEIIVIDDGSTDNTAEVVERFLPRIRNVRQANAERGASRNHGLRLAGGDYVAFLDSDDLWLPEKAEQDIAFLEANPNVGLVYTDALLIDSEGRDLGILRSNGPSGRVTRPLLEYNFVRMGTPVMRTSAVREIGGFRVERELAGSEDWEMWVRLSLTTDFAYLRRVSVKLRTHPGNTMTNASAMRQSMTRAAELFRRSDRLGPGYAANLRRMEANIALVNAINYCSQRDQKESAKLLRQAFSRDFRTLFDPRFGYTLLRLLKQSVGG